MIVSFWFTQFSTMEFWTLQDRVQVRFARPICVLTNVDQTVYNTFELFSGGFSGWSHVFRRLQQIGHNFNHRISVDFDPQCAETYCRSHGFIDMVGPTEMIWDADQLPEKLFIQGDVIDPRW